MKKGLVSIVIPNYNSGKYIIKCLDSVLQQSYQNIEIVIVDDGSVDSSIEIVEEYMVEHQGCIRLFKQANLNASMARNKGIENANGEFLFFLDSDDILYPDAIETMVAEISVDRTDMVIGNFNQIDNQDKVIGRFGVSDVNRIEEDCLLLANIVPNPSNKLYRRSIIKEFNIVFGNVRIGQDLNFFLKYILCCKSISLVAYDIYGWRNTDGSISNTMNFRIFDIVESFNNIKNFYIKNGERDKYEKYISAIEYVHFYRQMEKQVHFKEKKQRKLIVDFFSIFLSKMSVEKCINFGQIESEYKRCELKRRFKYLYISPFYLWLKRIQIR